VILLADTVRWPEALETAVSPEKMKALGKVAETRLRDEPVFTATARLGTAEVCLHTNDVHTCRRWRENWYAAPAEGDAHAPSGTVTVAMGTEGRPPAAYYCPRSAQVTLLDCNPYLLCHTWALALASDLLARESWIGLPAATVALDGEGVLILADDLPAQVGFAWRMAADLGAEVQNLTWCWLNAAHQPARAMGAEKCLMVPVEAADAPEAASEDGPGMVQREALPAATPADALLPVRHVVFLRTCPPGGEATCRQVGPRQAAAHLKGTLAARPDRWSTPRQETPEGDIYRRAFRQCVGAAQTVVLELPQGGTPDAFARWLDGAS
jgi:hypothetical protein